MVQPDTHKELKRLQRTEQVIRTLCIQINLMRLLCSRVCAQAKYFFVNSYLGLPSFSVTRSAQQAASVVATCKYSVLLIAVLWHVAKIVERIVVFETVDMIYLMLRPRAGHVKPCQTVCVIKSRAYLYSYVAFLRNCASRSSFFSVTAPSYAPGKKSGSLIVTEYFEQKFVCQRNIGFVHAFVLLRQWCEKWLPRPAKSWELRLVYHS